MEEGFVDVFSQAWVWVQMELGASLFYIISGTSSGKSWGIEAPIRYPPRSSPGLKSFKTEMLQEVTGDFKVCDQFPWFQYNHFCYNSNEFPIS